MKIEKNAQEISVREPVAEKIKTSVQTPLKSAEYSNENTKRGELNLLGDQIKQRISAKFNETYDAKADGGGGGGTSEAEKNRQLLDRGLDPLVSTAASNSSDRETILKSITDPINQYYDQQIDDIRKDRTIPVSEKRTAVQDIESQRQEHLKAAREEFGKNYAEASRQVNSDPAYRNLPSEDREAIAASKAATAWNDRVRLGEKILDDLKGVTAATGKATLDKIRQDVAEYFGPAGMRNSHQLMEAVRREGLLDNFLDATLRDADGKAVGSQVKDAVELVMKTGRLDVYAETLATTPVSLYDPSDAKYAGFGDNHVFTSGNATIPRGVYLNKNSLGGNQDLANVLAHELFHAYNNAHGGINGALNEGFGIAAREYAFSSGDYNVAEMVYGTKNYYRDMMHPPQPNYPIGDASVADPELRELMEAFASRDKSRLAWNDKTQLESEYKKFFEPINRNQAWADWLKDVEAATTAMLAAR